MKTVKLTTRSAWWEFRDTLKALTPFKTSGALSGDTWVSTFGQLPREWQDKLCDGRKAHGLDYVVYSYATPIAWHLGNGEWIMPDVKYSMTTSHHQSKIATAISQL